MGFNLFAYVENNPVVNIDPSGYCNVQHDDPNPDDDGAQNAEQCGGSPPGAVGPSGGMSGGGGGNTGNGGSSSSNSSNNSGSKPSTPTTANQLEPNVQESLNGHMENGFQGTKPGSTPGTHGGAKYWNTEGFFPDSEYREFDVFNRIPGMSRDGYRFILQTPTGVIFFTPDHYQTIFQITDRNAFAR